MKISKKDLKKIIKEEIEATLTEEFGDDAPFRARDMVPPKVRGKFKDTFTKIPHPGRAQLMGKERRPNAQEKAAWKAAGGYLSVFDKPAIAQFLEDAGLYDPEFGTSSLEKYMDNVKYAIKGDRLGRQINSLVDALALANKTGSRRGHLKTAKKKSGRPPQFTRESVTSMEEIIAEEIKALVTEGVIEEDGKGCADTDKGCIRKRKDGWVILNNKKGGIFRKCDSRSHCEEILDAFHASKG